MYKLDWSYPYEPLNILDKRTKSQKIKDDIDMLILHPDVQDLRSLCNWFYLWKQLFKHIFGL